MQPYLSAFINYKPNNWARVLPMTEIAYNNAKNKSIGHTLFILKYGYYFHIFYKKVINSYSRSKSANKLSLKLWELMIVCCENLYYIQEG